MKLRLVEVEANADELRSCNTVAQNLNALLARAFQPKVEDEEDVSEGDEHDEE